MADLTKTFEILAHHQSLLDDEIERINRRARRLGVPEVGYEVIDEYFTEIPSKIEGYPPTIRKYIVVKPVGEPVCVAGWVFIAKIEHHPSGINLIHHAPGEYENDLPERFRTVAPICEHCKTTRYRKDTFLLASEKDGRFMQVGRNCLKDFFGHSPEAIIQQVSLLARFAKNLEAAGEPGFRGADLIEWTNIEDYLAYVAKTIRVDGWCSRAMTKEIPYKQDTASVAWNYQHPHPSMSQREREESWTLEDSDKITAKNSLVWIRSLLEDERKSDYMHNLFTLCSLDYVEFKHLGIVASLIVCYNRAQERKIRRAAMADKDYFGTIGKREEFVLTFIGDHSFDGDCYNGYCATTRWLLRFNDEKGNVAIWWTSNSGIVFGMRVGETAKVRATVKAHKEYKGVKQTVLTRCKLIEVLEDNATAK